MSIARLHGRHAERQAEARLPSEGIDLRVLADAGERVFAGGLALAITAGLISRSLGISLSGDLEAAAHNIVASLVMVGVGASLVRDRRAQAPRAATWWYALPLFALFVAILLRSEVPLAYRLAVLAGSAGVLAGLFARSPLPSKTSLSPRASSRNHLTLTALAVAVVIALHGLDRSAIVTAAQTTAGAYLILVAPGIQLGQFLAPQTGSLQRLGLGAVISMAVVPLSLMWLVWLGVPPARETVLTVAAVLALLGALLVHLRPAAHHPEEP